MKPANFPERTRQRRLRALARLAKQPHTPERDQLIALLHERTADSARAIRTKKDRSGTRRAT